MGRVHANPLTCPPSTLNINPVMRKVTVALEIQVQVYLEDGVDVTEAIDEMDYDINVNPEHGDVINTEIVDFEVIDSK